MNIFSSIKIVDLTRVFSGPFATRHFAEFGAQVIKIEPPQGDASRNFPPLREGWSGYFEILNHNKQSLFLNLKSETDLQTFYEICASCDVLVENFSSSVTKKLGIDYEKIKQINPHIIYASIKGVSEHVDRKYYDVIAQAESGIISLNGTAEDMKISTSVVDAFTGMKLAYAISTALYAREKTGQGCKISVSMKGSAFDLLEQNLIETSVTKLNPPKVGNMDSAIAPFGVFKTKDSSIVIAIGTEQQWHIFEEFLLQHLPGLHSELFKTNQLRITHYPLLISEIEQVLHQFTSAEVISLLSAISIPCAQVNTMTDVLADQENYQEQLLQKIDHSIAGPIVVPTGGIFFSSYTNEKYAEAPLLESTNESQKIR